MYVIFSTFLSLYVPQTLYRNIGLTFAQSCLELSGDVSLSEMIIESREGKGNSELSSYLNRTQGDIWFLDNPGGQ